MASRTGCCGSSPCCRCSFRDDDWPDVGPNITEHWDTYGLVGTPTLSSTLQSADGSTRNCADHLSTPWIPCREISVSGVTGDPLLVYVTKLTFSVTLTQIAFPHATHGTVYNMNYDSLLNTYVNTPAFPGDAASISGNSLSLTVAGAPNSSATYTASMTSPTMPYSWANFSPGTVVFNHAGDDGLYIWPTTIAVNVAIVQDVTTAIHFWRFYGDTTWTPAGAGPSKLGFCIDRKWLSSSRTTYFPGATDSPSAGLGIVQLALEQSGQMAFGFLLAGGGSGVLTTDWSKYAIDWQPWASWGWGQFTWSSLGLSSVPFVPDVSPGADPITFGILAAPFNFGTNVASMDFSYRLDQFCLKTRF